MMEDERKYTNEEIEEGREILGLDNVPSQKEGNNQAPNNSKNKFPSWKRGLIIPISLILLFGIGFAVSELGELGIFRDLFNPQPAEDLSIYDKHGAYFDEKTISKEVIYKGDASEVIEEKKSLVVYSEVKNVYEDEQWKKIENARSLKDSGIGFGTIKNDVKYGYNIIDFNYTSITFEPIIYDEKELNKDISIKKDEVVKTKFNYDVLDKRKSITFYGDILKSNFTVGDESTTFRSNSSNNYEGYLNARDDVNYFTTSSVLTGYRSADGVVWRSVVNFSLSALPVGANVTSFNISFFKGSDFTTMLSNFTLYTKNYTGNVPASGANSDGSNFTGWNGGGAGIRYGGINITIPTNTSQLRIVSDSYFNLSGTEDGINVIKNFTGKDFRIMLLMDQDVDNKGNPAVNMMLSSGDDFGGQYPILFIEYTITTVITASIEPSFNITINSTNVLRNDTSVNLTLDFRNNDATGLSNITMNWYQNESAMMVLNMPFVTNTSDVKDYSGYNNNGTISGALWQRYLNEDNNSLVLLMPFDEDNSTTAIDKGDYRNNGVLGNITSGTQPTLTSNCVTGNCYSFDGVNDFINVSNSNYFQFGNNDFSWELWFKTNISTRMFFIGSDTSGNNGWETVHENAPNELRFYICASGDCSSSAITSFSGYLDNRWHHLVGVRNQSAFLNMSLYIDGSVSNHSSTSRSASDPDGGFRIGLRPVNTLPFNGSIDNVRIYNKALTSSEIQDHYEKYKLYYQPSFKFDGVNDVITVSNSNSLISPNKSITLEAWINPSVNHSSAGNIFNKYPGYQLQIRPGNFIAGGLRLNGADRGLSLSGSLTPNNWSHVVLTYDSGTRQANTYLNGKLDVTTTFSGLSDYNLQISSNLLTIGRFETDAERFNGSISSVRIYNRSLSANQIYELYNSYNTSALGKLVSEETTAGYTYRAQVTVANSSSLGNLTTRTNNITILSGGPTFATLPSINSTYLNNITNETLSVAFTPSTTGGSSQRANITWFSSMDNINFYSNVTINNLAITEDVLVVSTLHDANTSKKQYWLTMATLYDGGGSTYANSSSLFIKNANPDPPRLLSPINNLMNVNYTINMSASNATDIDPEDNNSLNYEFYLDREVNPPTTLYGNTTAQSNITSLGADGIYYWRARVNDGENVSIYTDIRSFLIDRRKITQNITISEIRVLGGTNQTFTLNLTINKTTTKDVNATLYYNGTIIATGKQTMINNANYSQFLFTSYNIIPTTGPRNAYWNVSLLQNNNTIIFNSSFLFEQYIDPLIMFNCSAVNSSTAIAINFTFRNEEDKMNFTRGDFEGTFMNYVVQKNINSTFTQNKLTNVTNYLLCISPIYAEFKTEARVNYQASLVNGTSYASGTLSDPRQYYFRNDTLNNATKEIGLHYLELAKATAIKFKITDVITNPLNNHIIKVNRFYTGENNYTIIAMGKTNIDGEDIIFLRQNDVPYKFIILDVEGIKIFESSTDTRISETEVKIKVGTDVSFSDYINRLTSVTSTLVIDENTRTFTLNYNDPIGVLKNGCLEVKKYTLTKTSTIGTTCLNDDNGTISITYPNEEGEYRARAYGTASPAINFNFKSVQIFGQRLSDLLGKDSTLAALIIIITVALALVVDVTASIVVSGSALVLLTLLGLLSLPYASLLGFLLVVGGILIWKLK